MKNVELMTDELYYRDVETNTKHKKESASVSLKKMFRFLIS
jgi:negative regulator of replication initiation